MDEATPDLILDTPPDAAIVMQLREKAQTDGESVIATFHNGGPEPFYLVVSDRGTCVLLDDHVTVQTFNREAEAEDVAAALVSAVSSTEWIAHPGPRFPLGKIDGPPLHRAVRFTLHLPPET